MGLKNDIFWSEIESEFREPGSTPPPRILRSTPRRFVWLQLLILQPVITCFSAAKAGESVSRRRFERGTFFTSFSF